MKIIVMVIVFMLCASLCFCQIPINVLRVFNENRVESFEKIIAIQYKDSLYFFTEGEYRIAFQLSNSKELPNEQLRVIANKNYLLLFTHLNTNPGEVNVKGIAFRYIEDGKKRKKKIDYVWFFIEKYVINYNF